MSERTGRTTNVTFVGKSGQRYCFQASPLDLDTRMHGGGVYIVTQRECLDRTFATKASHRCLAIGRTADFSGPVLTKTELKQLTARGANCICMYRVADTAQQAMVERDLVDGNEGWRTSLSFLVHPDVPPRAPG